MAKKRTAARKRAKTITSRAGNRLRGRTVAVGGYRATRYRVNPQGGIHRDDDGKLPAYAWPGGYPIIYITADGAVLCPDCANRKNGSLASTAPRTSPDWRIVGQSIHYEGPPETCDHCGARIESAYGDPNENPRGRRRGAGRGVRRGARRNPGGLDDIIAEARARGRSAGKSAGSWVIDGNTSDAARRRIAKGIEDGDPRVMDSIEEPSWLSGEYAGESISELLGDLIEEAQDGGEEDAEDEITGAYEEAASEAFWREVERSVQ